MLPRGLRDKCLRHKETHLNPGSVLQVMRSCTNIKKSLGEEKTVGTCRWMENVRQLIAQLMKDCRYYLKNHLIGVLDLCCENWVPEHRLDLNSENWKRHVSYLDDEGRWIQEHSDSFIWACSTITNPDHIFGSYIRLFKLTRGLQTYTNDEQPILSMLKTMEAGLNDKLVGIKEKIIKSPKWHSLSGNIRDHMLQLFNKSNRPTKLGSPLVTTRLPRATRTTQARENQAAQRRTNHPSNIMQSSSESSSRNSSPLATNRRAQGAVDTKNKASQNLGGSPSLRRSLLLAARAPQVPPSPSTVRKGSKPTVANLERPTFLETSARATNSNTSLTTSSSTKRSRSTLTQPTAASAAKSTPARHTKTITRTNQSQHVDTSNVQYNQLQLSHSLSNFSQSSNKPYTNTQLSKKTPRQVSSTRNNYQSIQSNRTSNPVQSNNST